MYQVPHISTTFINLVPQISTTFMYLYRIY